MKKAIIIIIILICMVAGYLYYDWRVQTQKMAAEPKITLYSWTDKNGVKHFTDTQPPEGVTDFEETEGHKYVEPPLVVKIKERISDFYDWLKRKISRKKQKKENRK